MKNKNNVKTTCPTPIVTGCVPEINAQVSMFDFNYSIDHTKKKGRKKRTPLFSLGQVTITYGVEQTIPTEEITAALSRHICGDWGDVTELECEIYNNRLQNEKVNEYSLRNEIMLFSEYESLTQENVTFYIITNDTRTGTTVLLPEELW